jgi:GTP-binding protein
VKITKANFIRGVSGTDPVLYDDIPQVVFIGRSNSGKSSTINALVNQNKLAITSSFPGRTQKINIFLINESFYFVDLPGYGYAKVPVKIKGKLRSMVNWYFFDSGINHNRIFVIVDANVGMTKDDLELLDALEHYKKNVIIIANKIDKIKKSEYEEKMNNLKSSFKIIPFSAKKKIGVEEVLSNLF